MQALHRHLYHAHPPGILVKIILSNYRYFLSGGPEKYLFAIEALLNDKGHTVLPFSVRSARNKACAHQERFLSPIADDNAVYAHEYKKTPLTVLKMLARQFYSPEAFVKARSFARFSNADLVYSLQYLNKMSPSVLDGFKSSGLPVVVRISDFGLICPQAHLFDGSSVCERCLGGIFFHAAMHRCVKNSYVAGLIKGVALTLQRLLGCQNRIDAFVFPSQFTLKRFLEAGFPEKKLHHIPTFISSDAVTPSFIQGDYILYFGRLVIEKGVHQLLEAYHNLPLEKPRLLAIGVIGNTPYSDSLIEKYKDAVEFHGFMDKQQLAEHLQKALFVVIPSLWYDNLPNVLLEAFTYGKAVVAPRHGSFIELIRDGETGLFYEPGNTDDLQEKLAWCISHPTEIEKMGRSARLFVEKEFSSEQHYRKLLSLFSLYIS